MQINVKPATPKPKIKFAEVRKNFKSKPRVHKVLDSKARQEFKHKLNAVKFQESGQFQDYWNWLFGPEGIFIKLGFYKNRLSKTKDDTRVARLLKVSPCTIKWQRTKRGIAPSDNLFNKFLILDAIVNSKIQHNYINLRKRTMCTTNYWKSINNIPFANNQLLGINAIRSDGLFVTISIPIMARVEEQKKVFKEGLELLESYRNCECIPGKKCKIHKEEWEN